MPKARVEASPFKKACEACTKAKSKCNGKNPCQLCEKRGIPCIYAFKRKRGPAKRSKVVDDEPITSKKGGSSGIVITPYERRLWTVFFTIFKNQENSYNDPNNKGMAWCWFARQLELLKKHCTKVNNHKLCEMIQSFLDSMNLKMKQVTSQLENACPFTPSICTDCASTAMMHPNTEINIEQWNPTGQQNGENLKVFSKKVPENATSLDSEPVGTHMEMLLNNHKNNTAPAFTFRQTDTPAHYSIVANSKFEETFGISSSEAEKLLEWSGNGFLPWGGDIVGKIIVSEPDLVTFLQIMCLKFQAIGVTNKDKAYIREVPSTHSFKFWVKTGEAQWSQKQCIMQCVHRVLKTPTHLSGHVVMSFQVMGAPYAEDKTHKTPIVSNFKMPGATVNENDDHGSSNKRRKTSTSSGVSSSSSSSSMTTAALPGAEIALESGTPLLPSFSQGDIPIDTLPAEVYDYYSNWDQVDSENLGYLGEEVPVQAQGSTWSSNTENHHNGSSAVADSSASASSSSSSSSSLHYSSEVKAGEQAQQAQQEQQMDDALEDSAWLEHLLDWHDEGGGLQV